MRAAINFLPLLRPLRMRDTQRRSTMGHYSSTHGVIVQKNERGIDGQSWRLGKGGEREFVSTQRGQRVVWHVGWKMVDAAP